MFSRVRRLAGPGFAIGCVTVILGACGVSADNSTFIPADGSDAGDTPSSNTPGFGPLEGEDAGGASDPDACAGGNCTAVAVCGDKKIDAPEACDDGNAIPGDGCSGLCQIEPGYTCPTPGVACLYTVASTCGNSSVEATEACDDGNKLDGDGCSAGCQVEPNYTCTTPGQLCTPTVVAECGNGTVDFGEQCDDTNKLPSDGCSSTCTIELGFTCPTPGSLCVKLEYCGDGILQTSKGEQCDDKNAVPGDGCSGVCNLEPGYACPAQGQPCVRIWECGNGKIDPGEACDDSNTNPADGCSADCSLVEAGWTCPSNNGSGGPCTPAVANTCGDGIVAGNEQCDDGNPNSTDGCSSVCAVEPGYTCPTPGAVCTKIAFCSDGNVDLALGEECDDANKTSGDGCTAQCKLEPNYVCPTPGQPCSSTVVCSDGKVNGSETCDDKNKVSGDGCSSTCSVEPGWQCPSPGGRCIAKQCGDGIKAGTEQCDDGDNNDTNGCSNSCKLVPGYACVTNGAGKSVCHATTCGDGTKEGFEQCDDGNRQPYDGCSPSCTIEPTCSGGSCQAVCGDGFKFPQEACDDGNRIDGDGCSSTCTLEDGFTCVDQTLAPPASLTIPILYRDMRRNGLTNGHPDFENTTKITNNGTGLEQGLVKSTLDSSTPYGKPVFQAAGKLMSNATNFCWWYHEKDCGTVGATNTYEKLVYLDAFGDPTTLTLNSISSNVYQYANTDFFPLDQLGWGIDTPPNGQNPPNHNFHFTSELHYFFTYQGGEKFDFTGDDDVWVFINGNLAVDIGGTHGAINGSITLSDVANNRRVNNVNSTVSMASLGLTVGNMYEISMFQAERHYTQSNYTLTLSGFVRKVTQCTATCGDGEVVGDEVCDDGAGNNTGAYGHCNADCKGRGPFCGDSTPQTPTEECDDGTNQSTYGGASKVCGPGCLYAPYCGDGIVSNGEQCDDGTANNTGAYGKCAPTCGLGPRCGDGIKDPNEACDHGVSNGGSGDSCKADCTLKCGDGVVQQGEQCDDGAANNTGGYGKCNPTCTLGPRCGDGLKTGNEQCDDGKNDGSYGTCKSDCSLANYCGDGTLTAPEQCDLAGANSSSAYGANLCTDRCTPAPRCGDKAVDGQFGEVCDDGVNSGQPGSCSPDCKSFVPLSSCGNGTINAPEQCDDGANNGTANSACDVHCRFKCGNGFKDPGETCDNGVNDGSYGGCTTNCQIAGYCGDGIKNGSEQCDNGGGNVSVTSAYGPGICTTACTFAPYCGDGRIQTQFGEECDSTSSCGGTCKTLGPK